MDVATRRPSLLALLGLAILVSCAAPARAADGDPWIVVFFEDGCPDCAQLDELLDGLIYELPEFAIVRYDISEPRGLRLLAELSAAYDVEIASVPVVFVGDEIILGVGRAQEFALRDAISDCTIQGCSSPLARSASLDFLPSFIQLTLLAVVFAVLFWWQTS